jgi:predicted Na+-dependent transporter
MWRYSLYQRGRHITGLATVITLLPVAAWACAVCFEGDDALARGLNMSILFLMSMPFVIFGSIFGAVYITYKRAQKHGSQRLAWMQKESVQ